MSWSKIKITIFLKNSFPIKKGLEKYVLEKYPELEQRRLINTDKKKIEAVSQKEFELKKRTGKITKRESIQYRLTQIFNSSPTKEMFFSNLEKNNIQIYVRGNSIGFKDLSDDKQRNERGLSSRAETRLRTSQKNDLQASLFTKAGRSA